MFCFVINMLDSGNLDLFFLNGEIEDRYKPISCSLAYNIDTYIIVLCFSPISTFWPWSSVFVLEVGGHEFEKLTESQLCFTINVLANY